MTVLRSRFFVFLLLFVSFSVSVFSVGGVKLNRFSGEVNEIHRRILHQPLFPETSTPPPAFEAIPSPPIPPDAPDRPFFPEVPSTPDQSQYPPPPPPASADVNGGLPIPTATTQSSKPGKKIAVVISVGIVTLGMLSGLAFFLYRHKVKHASDTQKLVSGSGGGDGGSRIFEEDPRPPTSSTFLYMGTVEPSRDSASESNGGVSGLVNSSPYRKLNSAKRSDRYRPSPELQPLPPLAKPQPSENSPSALSPSSSSSDEECRDTAFYTPHGSAISSDDGYYTPFPRSANSNGHSSGSIPHSKRTSPRSKFGSAATAGTAESRSPEMKHVIIPSIKQKPPPVQSPPLRGLVSDEQERPYSQNKLKFSQPPPPPNRAAFQAITQDKSPLSSRVSPRRSPPPLKTPPPPPPPPPPVPPPPPQKQPRDFQILRNLTKPEPTNNATTLDDPPRKQIFNTPSPKSKAVDKVNSKSAGSLEKTGEGDTDPSRPKLKPLHWDKVRASSDRATVWDQIKSSSFQLNEDRMEHLFGCNSGSSAPKEPVTARRSVIPLVDSENRVLDPKKSQNIAILLRALNVTREEVSEALMDGNPESLGADLLETLVKMAPTKEEEIKLREYSGDVSKLGTAERFLKTILDIPFAFKRVEAMLYRANFEAEVKYLKGSFQTLEEASLELKASRLFLKLLEAVLMTGNRMNVGTNRGEAKAFKLDTLLKLVDIKGVDGKTTLLHFVVQEITRSEVTTTTTTTAAATDETILNGNIDDFRKQGLQVVAGLSRDLGSVKKSAGMDFDVLSSYVTKLEMGLDKLRSFLKTETSTTTTSQGKFFDSMKTFLKEAEEEIRKIKGGERKALSMVKEVTEYFHGNAAREEAHPLRIFMVVRDFLGVLDNVCKEVKTMQEMSVMGSASARSFRISSAASLPAALHRYKAREDTSSDDDQSSSSST